jgi:ribosomal protein S18 acetylase RimI-like enzyme
MPASLTIRPAEPADLPALGRLGGQLVRYHRNLDPLRFLDIPHVDEGYARFLGSQLQNPHAVVLCACRTASAPAAAPEDGRSPASPEPGRNLIAGYAYGTLESRDWNALLDAHGALHDVMVSPTSRREGAGEALVAEMCKRLQALGAPRVVLHTAVQNEAAQALFKKMGFRVTMLEMTREL